MPRILVTGGAGFIGSNLVRHLLASGHSVLNLDKLTYAGNLQSLSDVADSPRYEFARVDIVDLEAVRQLFASFRPDAVMHLAAESHVDRSIDGPRAFIETNVVGTMNMLEASLEYWRELEREPRDRFRFLHVSTDEVYGSLGAEGHFTETTRYDPHSPYSASKAASDHLARAWHDTYGLPVLVTNCSNNYGPYQFPEKLIPVVILKCLRGEPIPVYGKGENIRDWLYVEDHCTALTAVLERGRVGETYNIGGNNERTNLELVQTLCAILDRLRPLAPTEPTALAAGSDSPLVPSGERVRVRGSKQETSRSDSTTPPAPTHQPPRASDRFPQQKSSRSDSSPSPLTLHSSTTPLAPSGERARVRGPQQETSRSDSAPSPAPGNRPPATYSDLITFVADRPGHDLRYAIDASKIKAELGWEPIQDHASGFEKTVRWYLDNESWWQSILSGDYKLERIGGTR